MAHAMAHAAATTPAGPLPVRPPEKAQTASPNLTFEREPFADVKPIKANVSGIMARLKKLKRGPEAAAASQKPVATAEGSEPAPVPAAAPGPAAPPAPGAGGTSAQAALKSAASRLKALALKKAQGTGAPAPADAQVEPLISSLGPPVPAPTAAPQGSPSAAATPDSEPAAAPAPAAADASAGAAEPPATGDASQTPREGAPVSAVKSMKLGGPASRLAALRKQKAT
jgi:hypothetical protein